MKKNNSLLLYGGIAIVGLLIYMEYKKTSTPTTTTTQNLLPPSTTPQSAASNTNALSSLINSIFGNKTSATPDVPVSQAIQSETDSYFGTGSTIPLLSNAINFD